MLKRIADWTQRAERLFEEIDEHMPAAYLRFDLAREYERDPVAYCWSEVFDHAFSLSSELGGLSYAIEKRTGITSDSLQTAKTQPQGGTQTATDKPGIGAD